MSNPNTDARHLRGPVTVSLLGGIVVVGCVALLADRIAGAAEARAVVVGAVVVTTFFGIGLTVMSAALKFHPKAALLLALMTYVLQMAIVTLAFVAMDRAGVLGSSVDATWLAVTVAVLTVLVSAGLMWWARQVRVPIYDLDDSRADEGSPGTSSGFSSGSPSGSPSGPLLRTVTGPVIVPVQGVSRAWEAGAR